MIWVKMVTGELATGHTTDGVDEVATVEIFEPVLVQIVCIGVTIEIHCRRIFPTFLVTGILRLISTCATTNSSGTYTVPFLVEHERGDGTTGVGAIAGLTTNTDRGTTPAILILGARNGAGGHRHDRDKQW